MYENYWGLSEAPFRTCLDPRTFYASPTHDEALARLHFLVEHGRRLGLLLGEAGSGKSLVLSVFAEQMRLAGQPVARVNVQGLEPGEMLASLGRELGLNLHPAQAASVLWATLADRLTEYRFQLLSTAILLDDADEAAPACRPWLLRLAQFDPTPEARLTLVLAGQRRRMASLSTQLLELAELRIDLETWDAQETAFYLSTTLARAGREAPVFAAPAIARLHELAGGVPRRINQLADLALLAGAGRSLPEIDAGVIESVYYELGMLEV